jgi:hypothetical protein
LLSTLEIIESSKGQCPTKSLNERLKEYLILEPPKCSPYNDISIIRVLCDRKHVEEPVK